jgi:KDO2-lipid IV(A) lauroyltransferase
VRPRYYVEVAGYRLLALLVSVLPLATARRWARGIAQLVWSIGGRRVRWTQFNLRVAFPDLEPEERTRIGRESYEHLAMNVIDFVRALSWDEDELMRHVTVVGEENLRKALAQGQGAFLLTLHLGNFELAARVFGALGIPTLLLGRPMANSRIYERLTQSRTAAGSELINRKNAVSSILRAIRSGQLVVILNDQYSRRRRSCFVPLFGARCSTSVGLATLVMRTGAPVLCGYVVRDAPDHHTATFLPPLEPIEPTGDRAKDIERATAGYNRALEAVIRSHPEQWMWAHRRFRHSPDLEPDPYGEKRSN